MQADISSSPTEGEAGRQYNGTVAIALALGLALFARLLFGFADAGPASNVITPVYPFIMLMAVFFIGRYAFRAFRHIRKGESYQNKSRGWSLLLAVLALLINGLVALFALFIGFMILNGPIIP
jgi:hypothetical protein